MSARDVAAKVPPRGGVPWDRLERAAFSGRLELLDGGSTRRAPAKVEYLWLVPTLIVVAFVALTPILGFVILSNGSRFATAARASDPHVTIPVAGVFFACAAAALVGLIIHWVVTKKPMAVRGFGLYTTIFATPALVAVRRMGAEQSVEAYELWSIPIAVAAGLGAILGVLLVVDRIRRGLRAAASPATAPGELSPDQQSLVAERQERIAQLSDAEREALQQEVDAAVQVLLDRGVIGADDAEQARSAELGALAIRMRASSKRSTRVTP